jgi:hypothetical protein
MEYKLNPELSGDFNKTLKKPHYKVTVDILTTEKSYAIERLEKLIQHLKYNLDAEQQVANLFIKGGYERTVTTRK